MQFTEIREYTEYLFRIAMQKCGNIYDAEDLTQEVILAALTYPHEIINMKSWMSAVLNNKYNDMLRNKYKIPIISIDMIPDEAEPIDALPDEERPNTEQIRREVAYLAKKYRDVVVLHYLYGEKVDDVAVKLGIPKGTVLSRLSYGREQMKKGFDSMENYEKLSYQPEKLEIGCHGCQGLHDEPWSLVSGDLMKQNILIAAYEKPLTSVEISKALGIPTTYIENSLQELASSELMRMIGNKYATDFMIVKPDELCRNLDAEIELTEEHYDELLAFINEYLEVIRKFDFAAEYSDEKRKKLEYYFILHLFSSAMYTVTQRIIPSKEEYPIRPDGGKWIAAGTRYPADFDFENYRFGKYCYCGERREYWKNILNAKCLDLHIYDTQPDLNRYNHGPVEISDSELAKLLYIIMTQIPIEATGFNVMLFEDIPHLIECGILSGNERSLQVALPVMKPHEYDDIDKIRIEHMYKMADLLEPYMREYLPKFKIEIPRHLEGRVAKFRQYSCYSIPMVFMKKAIADGDFDDANATPPMVLVVDDYNNNIR